MNEQTYDMVKSRFQMLEEEACELLESCVSNGFETGYSDASVQANSSTMDQSKLFSVRAMAQSGLRRRLQELFSRITTLLSSNAEPAEIEFDRIFADFKTKLPRFIHVVVNDAYQAGRASAISTSSPRKDPYVVKEIPGHYASGVQKDVYLHEDGQTARVFKLSDLTSQPMNNEGRMVKGFHNPVVGSTHPWCTASIRLATDEEIQKSLSFRLPDSASDVW